MSNFLIKLEAGFPKNSPWASRGDLGGLKLDEIDAANSFLMLPMARKGSKWPLRDKSRPAENQSKTENGHETDFYKAKRRIDDMNLHKKARRIQLEWWRSSIMGSKFCL